MPHPLLLDIARTDPGRYLTPDELERLRSDDSFLVQRLDAAIAAREKEAAILQATLEPVMRKYDFEARCENGHGKCYRDVAQVYRHAVFAMIIDDRQMLENKLLFWMRTIIQSFDFPGRLDSIRMTYHLLRQETNRHLPPEAARLLDPFLAAAEEILPS